MTESGAPGHVKSADRVLLLLEHLASVDRRPKLSELHQQLGIPKSSLHGLLQTLVARGWVEVDESKTLFGLGVRALLVGTSYIDSDEAVVRSREFLDQLAYATDETIHLGRLDASDIVYLATRQSTHDLRMFSKVGKRFPAHTSALGKAVLAENMSSLREIYSGRELISLTPNSVTDWADLEKDLEVTDARGYAIDREENTIGVNCFAVPLHFGPHVQYAVSISIPIARLDEERERELVTVLQETMRRFTPTRPPAVKYS